MRSVYTDYVRLYLLMDYSGDDSEFLARTRVSQARICQATRNLCDIANDMTNSLEDVRDQLARKRAKVQSLTQDKEQLIKEKADLMEQNRTLRNEVAHLAQQVLTQAHATIDAINTTNAETPAIKAATELRSRYRADGLQSSHAIPSHSPATEHAGTSL